jgi:manganese/zinc/iron transport system permease protein
MMWTGFDTWIVVTGVVISVACALVGHFLVVRRMSLMGDAISHAVLPGLAVAFLMTGTRHPLPMLAGATVAGLLTAWLTQWVNRQGRVEESAAMGVVFTSLFALGLVLVVQAAETVDLDPGCVLYGAIELAPLDTLTLAGLTAPRAFWTGLAVLIFDALVIALFYKELKITSFDPEAATALGIPAQRMYLLLMTLVAVTTVAAFEAVGSILVVAMLVAPAAAAGLVARRFGRVLIAALVVAAAGAAGGHLAAITVPTWFGFPDTSTSGSMAVITGLLFAGALLFAPEQGVVARAFTRRALRDRIQREDLLGQLFRGEEEGGEAARGASADWLGDRLTLNPDELRRAAQGLRRDGLVEVDGAAYRLTGNGREQAQALVRDHRRWERYLHDTVRLPADHVHATSEQLEHVTDEGLRRSLEQATEGSRDDPHGKPIP